MSFFKFILSVGLIILFEYSFAQTPRKRHAGLGIGWSDVAVKSLTTSSLTYRGQDVPIQLYFSSNGYESIHFVRAFYQADKLENRAGNYLTENRGGLQYAYHRRLSTMKDHLRLYGGGMFSSQASIRKGTGTNNQDGNVFAGFDVSALAVFENDKDRLEGQISSNIVAFAVSPDYSLSPPPEAEEALLRGESISSQALKFGRWSSLGGFYQITMRLSYDRRMSERFNLRTEYQWNVYKFRREHVFGSVMHQLIVSFVYKFQL